jgi:hypothetical protein
MLVDALDEIDELKLLDIEELGDRLEDIELLTELDTELDIEDETLEEKLNEEDADEEILELALNDDDGDMDGLMEEEKEPEDDKTRLEFPTVVNLTQVSEPLVPVESPPVCENSAVV